MYFNDDLKVLNIFKLNFHKSSTIFFIDAWQVSQLNVYTFFDTILNKFQANEDGGHSSYKNDNVLDYIFI